jgi:hypothetical protein
MSPRFVYRSSVASFPPQAPMIRAASPIPIAALASLDLALQTLLVDLHTAPPGSHAGAGGSAMPIDATVSYSFTLPGAGDLRASLPVSLIRTTVHPGQDGVVAAEMAGVVSQWKSLTTPSPDGAMVALDLTVFAKGIAAGGRHLPLAHLSQIAIVVPTDPAWWTIAD